MCTVCGCGGGETRIEGRETGAGHRHWHRHADGTWHSHDHAHDAFAHDAAHDHGHDAGQDAGHDPLPDLHFGTGPAGASAPGQDQARLVRIEEDVLSRNNALAAANRARLAAAGGGAFTLAPPPAAANTTLLVETLKRMGDAPAQVIEGDQETAADADRIRQTGAPAIQINTGKGCHLDAQMVAAALDRLPPMQGGTLFIENVGNLVCPAGFDLGETHRVVIASVTEGEDKPLKYPGMFASAQLMLVAKTDLLPHLDCDVAALIANARRVNPALRVLRISAKSGEGMADWLAYVTAATALARIGA
jgi:hydrogenase nickel incorporation protein HypB